MKDRNIAAAFESARRIVDTNPISIFERQLQGFEQVTAIISSVATLSSFTRRKAWPILFLTSIFSFAEKLGLLSKLTFNLLGKSNKHNGKDSITSSANADWQSLDMSISVLKRKKNQLEKLASSVPARPELMIFGAKDWLLNHHNEVTERWRLLEQLRMREKRNSKGWSSFCQGDMVAGLQGALRASLCLLVAYQPDYFGLSLSQLTFLEASIDGMYSSFFKLQKFVFKKLVKDLFEVRNLFECIEIKSTVLKLPEDPAPYIPNVRGMKVEFREVTFRYSKEAPPVLKKISFTIDAGQMVSIVGYNGSGRGTQITALTIGKTTLIKLLTLLEKPSQGEILINDVPISGYDPRILRTNISALFQDFCTVCSQSH